MSVFIWMLIGAGIGTAGSLMSGSRKNILGDSIVSAVGAFLGGWIATVFSSRSVLEFNWHNTIVALLGAIILAWVMYMLRNDMSTQA